MAATNNPTDVTLILRQCVTTAVNQAGLTPTEEIIARLMLKGITTEEIANLMGRSPKTIKQHVSTIFEKFGVHTRAMFFHCVFPT